MKDKMNSLREQLNLINKVDYNGEKNNEVVAESFRITESAIEVLERTKNIIVERGTERDLNKGERSMARCVASFNALTGNNISIEDGWRFMLLLKLSRQQEGSFKRDDYHDCVGYAALLAEEAIKNNE